MVNLGFSTGCFYQSGLHERKKLELIATAGCKAVELGFVELTDFLGKQLSQFAVLTKTDLAPFDYVSLHAPIHTYGRNELTKRVLGLIRDFHTRVRPLNLVVFHPDNVQEFSVFENCGLPVAFENMDARKAFGQSPSDMLSLMDVDENRRMVLDVNHSYTIHGTPYLAAAFWQRLWSWIDQVHLSGYAPPDHSHWPLFKTGQIEIIRSIQNWNLPIIVESVLAPEELVLERDYILENL